MKISDLLEEKKFTWTVDALGALFILIGYDNSIYLKVFLTNGEEVEGLLYPPTSVKNAFVILNGYPLSFEKNIALKDILKIEVASRSKEYAPKLIVQRLLKQLKEYGHRLSRPTRRALEPVANQLGVLTPDVKKIIEYIKQQNKK